MSTLGFFVFSVICGFLPFIAFVVVKKSHNLDVALVFSIILSTIIFAIFYLITPSLKIHIIAAFLMVLVLGLVSLKYKNPIYFLLEPAIKAFATAGYLVFFVIVGNPVLIAAIKSLADKDSKLSSSITDEQMGFLTNPDFLVFVKDFEYHLIFWMVVYGLIMLFVAKKASDVIWLICKFLYLPFILILPFVFLLLFNSLFKLS